VTTFVTPVLYLAAMGVGLGSFINKGGHSAALGGLSYLQFVAPGLAATTAATIGASESLFPVMAAIRWQKTYFGMLATPLRVGDVLAGHLIWIAARRRPDPSTPWPSCRRACWSACPSRLPWRPSPPTRKTRKRSR